MAEKSIFGTIDEAQCRRFEAGWRQGQPQPLEAFLPPANDPNFLLTLEELIAMELEWAWKGWQGQGGARPAKVEDYCARFPQLQAPSLVRLLQQEYLVRRQAGDAPSFAEFGERFPDLMDAGKTIGNLLNMAHTRTLELGGPDVSPGPKPVFDGRAKRRLPDLPGFDILEELGRGGMGVVYKARQRNLQRVVALKMILQGTQASAEELSRFQAEAEAVARLQHPNIVQIYEIGQHDGMPFLSLEFVNGGTLAQAMRKQPQAIRPTAQLVETLARAVHWAHEHGIVHRDLKPANILLSGEGTGARGKEENLLSSLIPKITDFGLAKRLESDVQHTKTGAVLGTPAYMAPEQAAGKTKEIGPRVDVYALGTAVGHRPVLAGEPDAPGTRR